MDDVALANYVAGCHTGPVEAARLDPFCAGLIGIPAGTAILLSDYTLQKLRHKHGEINFSHYHHFPAIQLSGFVFRGRKNNDLEFCWLAPTGLPFFVAIKATVNGEVYVSTFHRINMTEARRRIKRARKSGRLVREQLGASRFLEPPTNPSSKKKVA
jgi:hypothetical protein